MRDLLLIEEPNLVFGYNQNMQDPRDGLTLFGPVNQNFTYGIKSGVVGTQEGLRKFITYVDSLQLPIYNENNITRPFFPGFESVFKSKWDSKNLIFNEVTNEEISNYLFHEDTHTRTFKLVDLYANKIITAVENNDANVDLWFVIIPEEIYKYCRPKSVLPKDLIQIKSSTRKSNARKELNLGADSMFDYINEENEPYKFNAHFHNQLKARLLNKNIATQLLRESTIDWKNCQKANGIYSRDFSKIEGHLAWSISTAAYYKTSGPPWKLADIRKGVCYLGLVYKIDEKSNDKRNACCAAQMFLDNGEGTIFRGAVGPWYNRETKEFHLSKKHAYELLELALNTYKEKQSEYPNEIFIHAKTRFNKHEWEGFMNAVPSSVNLVGITIDYRKSLKLYRQNSNFPVIRGMAYLQNENSGFLWTKGYIPRLTTSSSLEIPNPIFIEINKGKSDLLTVFKDILALTKLNYNACIYGDGIPVTLRFANAVGEILTSSPLLKAPPLAFKYYI